MVIKANILGFHHEDQRGIRDRRPNENPMKTTVVTISYISYRMLHLRFSQQIFNLYISLHFFTIRNETLQNFTKLYTSVDLRSSVFLYSGIQNIIQIFLKWLTA